MEQEEIVIKKGKKLKQQKLIKLRDYDIQQPDYCLTPGATLVYHQDRITMIHEESCQSRIKTIQGDMLPEALDAKNKGKDEEQKEAQKKSSTFQIDSPIIT